MKYDFIYSRWPSITQPVFIISGAGVAIIFSITAAVVHPREGLSGFLEIIAQNLLWGIGYGVILPFTIHLMKLCWVRVTFFWIPITVLTPLFNSTR